MIPNKFLIWILIFFTGNIQAQNIWTATGITDSVIGVSGIPGLISAATQNNGIITFNTVTGRTQHYNIESGDMQTNDFRSITFISNSMYAGSFDDGLYVNENNSWQHFNIANSLLPGNSVTDFAYDSTNEIIYVATNGGLVSIHSGVWTIYDSVNSPLPGNSLTCLFLDDANRLWIGTRYSGMAKLQDGTWEIYNFLNSGINDNYIKAITEDDHGYLYVADYFGINKYEIAADDWVFVFNTFTSPISSDRINRMGFDDDGTMWIATHDGINSVDTANQWTAFFAENSDLPHNTCDGLFIGDDQTIWAGTYGGLAFYGPAGDREIFPSALSIEPNPVHDQLNVFTLTPMHITISTMAGNAVLSGFQTNNVYGESKTEIPLSSLSPGMYLISADDGEKLFVLRFIKL